MKQYFMRTSDYGTSTMNIIDLETLEQAERGENYLNPEDYDFLCEAEDSKAAAEYYWNVEFQSYASSVMLEA